MILVSQNKNIITIYVASIIAIIMNFPPSFSIDIWGGVLFIMTFIITYVLGNGLNLAYQNKIISN